MRNSQLGRIDVDDVLSRLGPPLERRSFGRGVFGPADLVATVSNVAGVETSFRGVRGGSDFVDRRELAVDAAFVAVKVDLLVRVGSADELEEFFIAVEENESQGG